MTKEDIEKQIAELTEQLEQQVAEESGEKFLQNLPAKFEELSSRFVSTENDIDGIVERTDAHENAINALNEWVKKFGEMLKEIQKGKKKK